MEDKLSPDLQHGLLSSEENVFLNNFSTLCVWVLVCPAVFMDTGKWQPHCNGSVIAIVLLPDVMPWLVMADVITTLCCCVCGRLKATETMFYHIILYICVADGKPLWQVLWPHVLSKWKVLLPLWNLESVLRMVYGRVLVTWGYDTFQLFKVLIIDWFWSVRGRWGLEYICLALFI